MVLLSVLHKAPSTVRPTDNNVKAGAETNIHTRSPHASLGPKN